MQIIHPLPLSPSLIGVSLDEEWSYRVVGGVKETSQSKQSGKVQLRKETVKLMEVVGDDRRLYVVGGARGGARNNNLNRCIINFTLCIPLH